jgi:Bacterial protein of unknown function (DUF937)
MAIDLTSLVSDYLTPQLVARIASAVGVNPTVAQNLVDAAVPAIIGALGTAAVAPGGAKKISDAVSNADPDLLTKLSSSLNAGSADVASGGTGALGGILGGSGLSSLAGALAQFAGVPQAAAQSTIGAASQAVVGVIGQQDPSLWSDPAAIGNLLASQKDIVGAALPSGLANMLSRSGLVSGVGAMAAGAAVAASGAASSASSAAGSALNQARSASSSSSFPMWLIIVIAVVVIAAVYFYISSHRESAPTTTGSAAVELALWRNPISI